MNLKLHLTPSLFLLIISSIFSCNDNAITFTTKTQGIQGEVLKIDYSQAIPSIEGKDQYWITLVPKNMHDSVWGDWKYVDNGATTEALKLGVEPGEYEIRLHSQYPKKRFNVIARQRLTVGK